MRLITVRNVEFENGRICSDLVSPLRFWNPASRREYAFATAVRRIAEHKALSGIFEWTWVF
jgi:hypothetical protein